MFGKEKNDPEMVVGCVAEMKLTVLSEAGERIRLVREKVLMAMENEAIDFIRLSRIGRLEGELFTGKLKRKWKSRMGGCTQLRYMKLMIPITPKRP